MNDDQLFLFFNRMENKLDQIAATSAAETARWNDCRIEDQRLIDEKLRKKAEWSWVTYILSGVGIGLAFIFLMSLDIKNDISTIKTELSVHMGAVIKSVPIDMKGVME